MDSVAWDDSMSVGVEVLDNDHKRLLTMLNSLLKSGVTRSDKSELRALLAELGEYTDVHFTREEESMRRQGYPDLEAHRAAHRYFVDEVEKLRAEFDGSHATMLRIDLVLLLKEWLIEHIQSTDAKYKPYLAG